MHSDISHLRENPATEFSLHGHVIGLVITACVPLVAVETSQVPGIWRNPVNTIVSRGGWDDREAIGQSTAGSVRRVERIQVEADFAGKCLHLRCAHWVLGRIDRVSGAND